MGARVDCAVPGVATAKAALETDVASCSESISMTTSHKWLNQSKFTDAKRNVTLCFQECIGVYACMCIAWYLFIHVHMVRFVLNMCALRKHV